MWRRTPLSLLGKTLSCSHGDHNRKDAVTQGGAGFSSRLRPGPQHSLRGDMGSTSFLAALLSPPFSHSNAHRQCFMLRRSSPAVLKSMDSEDMRQLKRVIHLFLQLPFRRLVVTVEKFAVAESDYCAILWVDSDVNIVSNSSCSVNPQSADATPQHVVSCTKQEDVLESVFHLMHWGAREIYFCMIHHKMSLW